MGTMDKLPSKPIIMTKSHKQTSWDYTPIFLEISTAFLIISIQHLAFSSQLEWMSFVK